MVFHNGSSESDLERGASCSTASTDIERNEGIRLSTILGRSTTYGTQTNRTNTSSTDTMMTAYKRRNISPWTLAATDPTTLEDDFVNRYIDKDDHKTISDLLRVLEKNNIWVPRPRAGRGAPITSSLHRASEKGAINTLQVLLKASPPSEILDMPDHKGNTPLMAAVTEGRLKAAEVLLNAGAHINARNDSGQSCLHLLVLSIHTGVIVGETIDKFIDLLLNHPDIDLEPHNDSAMTPLALAAEVLPACDDVPQSSGIRTFSERLVIPWASCVSINRPTSSEFLDMIILRRDVEDISIFLEEKSLEEAQSAVNCRLGSQTLLFHAVDSCNEPLVNLLLKAGANPWASEITNELPIHCAAAKGHFDIMDCIIKYMKDDEMPVDLRVYTVSLIEKLLERRIKHKMCSHEVNYSKCLERMLKPDVLLDVNQTLREYGSETTPLHVAASFNNQEVLSMLLRHGAFLGAQRIVEGKKCGTVLGALLPSTLEHVMDGCITHNVDEKAQMNENIFADDYALNLDYSFLTPPDDPELKNVNEMKTLRKITESELHAPSITHPLIQALLYAKWYKALGLFIINFILTSIFVFILTAFLYCIKDLRILEAKASLLENRTENATVNEYIAYQKTVINWLFVSLSPFAAYMIIREVFQLLYTSKNLKHALKNILECALAVFAFLLYIFPLDLDSTRHAAAWIMILAWFEFVLALGRIPPIDIYLTMLREVSLRFIRIAPLFGGLILGFTICFTIIFQSLPGQVLSNTTKESEFSNLLTSLPKVLVMSTGEFDYSDLKNNFSQKIVFFISELLGFVLFIFLIFLVLMNVIIGVAVTDTQKIADDALLYSSMSRLEIVYLIESVYLKFPFIWQCLRIRNFQILVGSHNSPVLRAKINKKRRLLSGTKFDIECSLNNSIARKLRIHRIRHLEEEDHLRRREHVSHNQEN